MKTTLVPSIFAALALAFAPILAGCIGSADAADGADLGSPATAEEATDEAAAEEAIDETSSALSSLTCFTSKYYCDVTVATGAISCPNLPNSNDVVVTSTVNGLVLSVNMSTWSKMQVEAKAKASQLYTFHIGDSPTNDGWAGDAGTTTYDAEAHLYDNGLLVYRNDLGGSTQLGSLANAIPGGAGSFCAVVAEEQLVWYGTPVGSAQPTTFLSLSDPSLFRPSMGDKKLYVGINRTVGSAARTGSAIGSVVRISLAP